MSRSRQFVALILCLHLAPSCLHSQENLNVEVATTVRKIDKWVETRRAISERESEWASEKEALRNTRDLLRQRVEDLRADIEALEVSSDQTATEQSELVETRARLQRETGKLTERVTAMESRVEALAAFFPEPLTERLSPFLSQIPENPEETEAQLGQRYLNVLGILGEVERFNATTTLVGDDRELPSGERVAASTVFWGLAFAYSSDSQGQQAFFGSPTTSGGWTFTPQEGHATDARLLLDIAEGNTDEINFVLLPVSLTEIRPSADSADTP
jgi:hypothetical protein